MSTFKSISKDVDVIGTDKYRVEDLTIPQAYRASTQMSISVNKVSTNNNVTIRDVTPVVNVIDGKHMSSDSFIMTTKFTSLQHITNDVEREATFDRHMAVLVAAKAAILKGELPSTPIVIA